MTLANVPLGPLGIAGTRRLSEEVFCGKWPVLSLSAFGTPAAVWNVVLDRKVESRSVNASLATRDDLLESFQIVAHRLVAIKVVAQEIALVSHLETSPVRHITAANIAQTSGEGRQ